MCVAARSNFPNKGSTGTLSGGGQIVTFWILPGHRPYPLLFDHLPSSHDRPPASVVVPNYRDAMCGAAQSNLDCNMGIGTLSGGGIFYGRVGGWTAIQTPPRFYLFPSLDNCNPALVVTTYYWDVVCDAAWSESNDKESIGMLFLGGVGFMVGQVVGPPMMYLSSPFSRRRTTNPQHRHVIG